MAHIVLGGSAVRLMQFILLLSVSIFILAACNANDPVPATLLPTLAVNSADDSMASDESPRPEDDGPSGSIPPTWTPAPVADDLPAQQPAFATRAPDESYVVQPGDTLAEIAEEFGVDLDRLARANNIQNIDFIATGQVLTIPR